MNIKVSELWGLVVLIVTARESTNIQKERCEIVFLKCGFHSGERKDSIFFSAYGVDDANDWAHMGFECFVKLLDIYHPKYYIHGHIHLNYGGGHTRRQQYGETEIINGYQFHKFEYETGNNRSNSKIYRG